MNGRGTVRPGKAPSAMGFVIGLIFVAIGLFVAVPTFGAFGVVWTLIAVAITVYNGINAFSTKGVAAEVIDFETSEPVAGGPAESSSPQAAAEPAGAFQVAAAAPASPEQRLTTLDDLLEKGMVTEAEYEEQRERILSEL